MGQCWGEKMESPVSTFPKKNVHHIAPLPPLIGTPQPAEPSANAPSLYCCHHQIRFLPRLPLFHLFEGRQRRAWKKQSAELREVCLGWNCFLHHSPRQNLGRLPRTKGFNFQMSYISKKKHGQLQGLPTTSSGIYPLQKNPTPQNILFFQVTMCPQVTTSPSSNKAAKAWPVATTSRTFLRF